MDTERQEVVYLGAAVAEKVGISYHQLDFWVRTGLIVSTKQSDSPYVGQHVCRESDIVDLVIVKWLLAIGIPSPAARVMLSEFRGASYCTDLHGALVLFSEDDVQCVAAGMLVRDIGKYIGKRHVVTLIVMDHVFDEVSMIVSQLKPFTPPTDNGRPTLRII